MDEGESQEEAPAVVAEDTKEDIKLREPSEPPRPAALPPSEEQKEAERRLWEERPTQLPESLGKDLQERAKRIREEQRTKMRARSLAATRGPEAVAGAPPPRAGEAQTAPSPQPAPETQPETTPSQAPEPPVGRFRRMVAAVTSALSLFR